MKYQTLSGSGFTLASALLYAIQAAVIKLYAGNISLPMIVFSQSLVALILLMPILLYQNKKVPDNLLATKIPLLHLWRTVFSLGISYFLFASLYYIPLVDGVLLANTAPFFIPFILLIFAKQKLQHTLWLPLAIGFIGIIFILKPDGKLFDYHALIALGAGLSMAGSITMVRNISTQDNSLTIIFYYFLFSTIIAGIAAMIFWQEITLNIFMLLALIGLLFFFVQYLLVIGLKYITAQSFSVLYYANVIFAAILGMIIFHEVSDTLSIIGILLAIISAIVIIKQQTLKQKTA
ncbi:DMT family transporter [Facilibium subflavum]|uniref:DMT family transporter n=1 Tax=Facilibium subflavum TaxID=2219058 RepID=UPI000E65DF70|nr:DMT family transporter [Facilibium subflavum]